MQELMNRNPDGTQRMPITTNAAPGVPEEPTPVNQEEPGVPEVTEDPEPTINITEPGVPPVTERRRTRSQTYEQHPVGTIVRKWFNDNKWHEGEVTGYDAKNNLYKVKYQDGDIEEYDPEVMRKFKKKRQQYSKPNTSSRKETANYSSSQYDENIFFIPTKACPNPIKADYQRR